MPDGPTMKPIRELADDLAAGRTTSRALVEAAVERARDPAGEGARVFVKLRDRNALTEAEAIDRLRAAGCALSPIAGIPISVKDLFDVAGDVTLAASRALADEPPAAADSEVVRRLRQAGAVVVGRTNMTEFAYSGLGVNPHFGTPKNPWDRATGRIPGGSSSGAGVSVSDGMAAGAIGSDTGGSVRIPAALCGVTGLKTTTGRIPLDGVFPLSETLDSAGPLAPGVACCAMLDAAMAARPIALPEAAPIGGLRFAVPKSLVFDDLDDHVGAAIGRALSGLSAAGARIVDVRFDELGEIPGVNVHGGILGAEAYAVHRRRLEEKGDLFDPRVRARIQRGANLSAADYLDIRRARADLMARADRVTAPFDAVLMPSCARIAPEIEPLVASDDLYAETNPLLLRNTTIGNFLDRCALSLPCHREGEPPVGLMVMDETGADDHLIAVGLAVEAALGGARS